MTLEIRTGDPRFPMVANETAMLIEAAVERLGLGVDEAVCIVLGVAADYGRSEYGDEYLDGLADVVTARRGKPLPIVEPDGREAVVPQTATTPDAALGCPQTAPAQPDTAMPSSPDTQQSDGGPD